MTVSEKVKELLQLNYALRKNLNYDMTEDQLFDFELFGEQHAHTEFIIEKLPLDKIDNENIHALLDIRKKMLLNNYNKGHYGTFVSMSNHLPNDIRLDLILHGC